MPLCDLCLTVPFTALPRLPQERRGLFTVADNAESTQVTFQAGDEITSPDAELPDPIGFPFHEDLEALALSARSCPVCNIAQAGVQGWIDRWEDAAKNNKSFIEFSLQRQPVPTGQRLWLTACDDGEQGFFLWAKNPAKPKYLYQLAAVRLYAESSMSRPSNSCSKVHYDCCTKLLTISSKPFSRAVPSAPAGIRLGLGSKPRVRSFVGAKVYD